MKRRRAGVQPPPPPEPAPAPPRAPGSSPRAFLYARVSTEEQTTEQQVVELRRAAERMRLDVVKVIEETGSGTNADRPGLVALMDAARHHEVDAILVWKLDRLGRSLIDLARKVEELRGLRVRLVAVTQGIDLDPERDDPAARFAAQVLGAASEFEHALIVERTNLGLARVRREESTDAGRAARRARKKKAIGRPSSLLPGQVQDIRLMREGGSSWAQVAKSVGCSPWAARRAIQTTPPKSAA